MTDKIIKSEQEWQKRLTPQQYQVCRQKGTERAFTGAYWNSHERGTYRCVCCGAALFGSNSKFDSGYAWPSFWQPLEPANIAARKDHSFLAHRTEVVCALRCPSGTCIQRRTRTHRFALLHQFSITQARPV